MKYKPTKKDRQAAERFYAEHTEYWSGARDIEGRVQELAGRIAEARRRGARKSYKSIREDIKTERLKLSKRALLLADALEDYSVRQGKEFRWDRFIEWLIDTPYSEVIGFNLRPVVEELRDADIVSLEDVKGRGKRKPYTKVRYLR